MKNASLIGYAVVVVRDADVPAHPEKSGADVLHVDEFYQCALDQT